MLPRIRPMRLRLVREPFDNPDYIFELKHDGFRATVFIENRECRLVSRNLKNLRFESLKAALARLPVRNAILDGEIVCLDENGVSRFNRLLSRKAEPILYAFDLLWLDGKDLRQLPLIERKSRLAHLVELSKCERLLFAQHVEGAGKELFAEICRRDLEGIVAKRKTGVYREDRQTGSRSRTRPIAKPRVGTIFSGRTSEVAQGRGRHDLFRR